uniref:Mitochondrial basic amino acids transporter n=1 Tax=Glossina brevipalpis TaxID=37001 RepID=A0A1A9W5D5_9MUSC
MQACVQLAEVYVYLTIAYESYSRYMHSIQFQVQINNNLAKPRFMVANTSDKHPYYNMTLDFIAGCLGGAAGVLVSHPLDTIKVHLQTQNPKKIKYHGTWHCLTTIVKEENVHGLYKGMTSPLAGLAAVNAIVFGIYGNVQRMCRDPSSLEAHAISGGVAGFFQSVACAPMELAKIRMQLQTVDQPGKKFNCPLDYLLHVVRTEGYVGTMRGVGFTAFRDVPGFAAYFSAFEFLTGLQSPPTAWWTLTAGGFAGIASWLVSYPIDVVKTCIQADDPANPKFKGYMDVVRKGYKSEGLHFFFRGINSTMIRSFPMNAACFYVVSAFMNYFANDGPDDVANNRDSRISMTLAANTPLSYIFNHVVQSDERIRQQHLAMTKSLQTFSTFSEAICHSDAEELATEWYSATKDKYFVLEDARIIAEEFITNERPVDC